ncbi:hypothetical protein [Halorientalis salina]|uniref:hypothetical protein n=1 Tax=Halorientalis salina TaxID=2932266 RepID=UPI0010AD438D|nr:hypothetical protein [Halorientalis salina]
MKPVFKFLVLLVPYAVFIGSGAVVGGAFFVPEAIFSMLGTSGYLTALIATAVSLFVMVKSSTALRSLGHEINRRPTENTAEQ